MSGIETVCWAALSSCGMPLMEPSAFFTSIKPIALLTILTREGLTLSEPRTAKGFPVC